MKEGLIRLTDEKDIFYDSIEKVYRYRQHCPQCGTKIDTCMCYNDLELLFSDIDDNISDYTCSAKCSLLAGDWDYLSDAMENVGCYRKASELIKNIPDNDIKEYLEGIFLGYGLKINLKEHTRDLMLTILKENQLEEDIIEHFEIDRGKSIEELTEDEAKEVLEMLTSDYDGDYPHGDFCVSETFPKSLIGKTLKYYVQGSN